MKPIRSEKLPSHLAIPPCLPVSSPTAHKYIRSSNDNSVLTIVLSSLFRVRPHEYANSISRTHARSIPVSAVASRVPIALTKQAAQINFRVDVHHLLYDASLLLLLSATSLLLLLLGCLDGDRYGLVPVRRVLLREHLQLLIVRVRVRTFYASCSN